MSVWVPSYRFYVGDDEEQDAKEEKGLDEMSGEK